MKHILLSADSDSSVYLVPDDVVDHLRKYCNKFDKWLHQSPDAKKYRSRGGVCYNETDFIEYLNKWVFPNEKSVFVEEIGWISSERDIPEKYKGCVWFNF